VFIFVTGSSACVYVGETTRVQKRLGEHTGGAAAMLVGCGLAASSRIQGNIMARVFELRA